MIFIIPLAIITIVSTLTHFFIGLHLGGKIRNTQKLKLEDLAPWSFLNLISSSASGLGLAVLLSSLTFVIGAAIHNFESPKNLMLISVTLFFALVAVWMMVESVRQCFIYKQHAILIRGKAYRLNTKKEEIQINTTSIPFTEIEAMYWFHTPKNFRDFRVDLDHALIDIGSQTFFISEMLIDIPNLAKHLPERVITKHKSNFQQMPKSFEWTIKEVAI